MDVKNSGWVPFLASAFEGVSGRIDDSTNFQGYAIIAFLGGTGLNRCRLDIRPIGAFLVFRDWLMGWASCPFFIFGRF